ncbi:MAG: hypothetical protein P4L72_17000 [Parvibaculum sp.]|uniref:hypothetical protein n=1 Tax=Parvibaculum sp. TaxID=2024848 RepID=UPI0028441105|nr:hypothetical protein [Parvibaculum sp.]MDR3500914.1 hypothetical protein [Parvibaculum sp.]
MTKKTYIGRSRDAVPFDIALDRASLDAAHASVDNIKTLTGIDASIPIIVRTALRYLTRHLQNLPKGTDAETAGLRLKVDVMAAARGIASV